MKEEIGADNSVLDICNHKHPTERLMYSKIQCPAIRGYSCAVDHLQGEVIRLPLSFDLGGRYDTDLRARVHQEVCACRFVSNVEEATR